MLCHQFGKYKSKTESMFKLSSVNIRSILLITLATTVVQLLQQYGQKRHL